jgi:putative lipoic acid-binding regulatory protein
MQSDWKNSLKEKLDQHHAWPDLYTFKFIVPAGKESQITALFPNHTTTRRSSNKGNYTSITVQMMMPSSDAVIDVYVSASAVEGVIAL